MSEIEDKLPLTQFIRKRRKPTSLELPKVGETPARIPWYRRPLLWDEFEVKRAKNERYYVRHHEWGKHIWIGPYKLQADAEDVIDSYVEESRKGNLDRKADNNIHSVIIDNEEEFF